MAGYRARGPCKRHFDAASVGCSGGGRWAIIGAWTPPSLRLGPNLVANLRSPVPRRKSEPPGSRGELESGASQARSTAKPPTHGADVRRFAYLPSGAMGVPKVFGGLREVARVALLRVSAVTESTCCLRPARFASAVWESLAGVCAATAMIPRVYMCRPGLEPINGALAFRFHGLAGGGRAASRSRKRLGYLLDSTPLPHRFRASRQLTFRSAGAASASTGERAIAVCEYVCTNPPVRNGFFVVREYFPEWILFRSQYSSEGGAPQRECRVRWCGVKYGISAWRQYAEMLCSITGLRGCVGVRHCVACGRCKCLYWAGFGLCRVHPCTTESEGVGSA